MPAEQAMSTNDFLKALKQNKERLTRQQVKTLRGQALAGNVEGAEKGLKKLIGGQYEISGRCP